MTLSRVKAHVGSAAGGTLRTAFPVAYLAHPRDACLAEVRRNFALGAGDLRPAPPKLFTIQVHQLRVLHLTTEQQLAAVA